MYWEFVSSTHNILKYALYSKDVLIFLNVGEGHCSVHTWVLTWVSEVTIGLTLSSQCHKDGLLSMEVYLCGN